MSKLELFGEINESGRLNVFHGNSFGNWCRNNIGSQIILTIKKRRKSRSNPQNQYYWGIVVPTVQAGINDFGNAFSVNDTHEFLKKEFNYSDVECKEGYFIKMPNSTTEMDTIEFADYLDKIKAFSIEVLGVRIPEPNEHFEIQ